MSDGSFRVPAMPLPGGRTVVVTLPGEIDVSNEARVREALATALAGKPKVVIADGTQTEFCDCAAVTALIRAHHRAATEEAQLRVVLTSPRVLRVLELIGAQRVLRIYPSLDDALAGGQRQPTA